MRSKANLNDDDSSQKQESDTKLNPAFEEVILSHNNNKSIIFNGIEFSRKGRRTKEPIDEVDLLEKKQKWKGSYRALAAIIESIVER